MSDELRLSVGLCYSKDGQEINVGNRVITIDVSGNNVICGTLTVTTNAEYVPKGDVSSVGYSYWENIGDNTVYLTEGLATSPRFTLKPGEVLVCRLAITEMSNPVLKADAGSTRVKYILFED